VLKDDDQAAIADDPMAADRQHSRGLTEQRCVLAPNGLSLFSRSSDDYQRTVRCFIDLSSCRSIPMTLT
jgi:hypothetical protein